MHTSTLEEFPNIKYTNSERMVTSSTMKQQPVGHPENRIEITNLASPLTEASCLGTHQHKMADFAVGAERKEPLTSVRIKTKQKKRRCHQ